MFVFVRDYMFVFVRDYMFVFVRDYMFVFVRDYMFVFVRDYMFVFVRDYMFVFVRDYMFVFVRDYMFVFVRDYMFVFVRDYMQSMLKSLRWFGHVQRRYKDDATKLRWRDLVKEDMTTEMAEDRRQWHVMIQAGTLRSVEGDRREGDNMCRHVCVFVALNYRTHTQTQKHAHPHARM